MKLYITIKDIDYKSIISFVNENAGQVFGIFRLGNLNSLTVKAINSGEVFIIRKLQNLCQEHGVEIRLNGIHAEEHDAETIMLSADIEEIDVASVTGLIIPAMQKHFSSADQLSFLSIPMQAHPEAFTTCISSFMGYLSKEEKDSLMVSAINAFNGKIISGIERFANKKNLSFTIVSLIAE